MITDTHQGGLGQGLNTAEYRGPWAASCQKRAILNGTYPFCDPRLHSKWSTAGPRSGRHSLAVQIPTKDTVALLNFPQKWPLKAGVDGVVPESSEAGVGVAYRVEVWARSSPQLVNATRNYTSRPLLPARFGYRLTGCLCFPVNVGFESAAWAKAHKGDAAVDPPGTVGATELLAAGRWMRLSVDFTNATRGTERLMARLSVRSRHLILTILTQSSPNIHRHHLILT